MIYTVCCLANDFHLCLCNACDIGTIVIGKGTLHLLNVNIVLEDGEYL